MLKWLYRLLIELTNQPISSKVLKAFSKSRLSTGLIPSYAKIYKINQDEMEKKIKSYASLQDFFVRRLKSGSRQIDLLRNSVVSPVDAIIEEIGVINGTNTFRVKGKEYSIAEMLGQKANYQKYIDGIFVILYLSPSHYHRIHSPISGTITHQWSLGQKSYPVNKLGLKYGKHPLAKNFRKITEVTSDGQHLAIVKVGAMFINSIEMTHTSEQLIKGEEIAYFSFGSTVVLLFEKGKFKLDESIVTPMEVKVGEKIGYFSDV